MTSPSVIKTHLCFDRNILSEVYCTYPALRISAHDQLSHRLPGLVVTPSPHRRRDRPLSSLTPLIPGPQIRDGLRGLSVTPAQRTGECCPLCASEIALWHDDASSGMALLKLERWAARLRAQGPAMPPNQAGTCSKAALPRLPPASGNRIRGRVVLYEPPTSWN